MSTSRRAHILGTVTPEQITLVERTVEQARGCLVALAEDFYERLFAADPDLRQLFTTDPDVQHRKFAEQLDAIAFVIRHFDRFSADAAELGRRHRTYGVHARDYAVAGPPLLAALAAALGDEWTVAVEAAWRRAYHVTVELMLAAGAPGHPPDPP